MFQNTHKAVQHNWLLLQQYPTLGEAILADQNSLLRYGSESRPAELLEQVFHLHPLWPRMQSVPMHGIAFPLSPLSTKTRAADLAECLIFANHKGVEKYSQFFNNLMESDVTRGYSLILPLPAVSLTLNALMAPLNIIEQNIITEHGKIVPKKRLIHNQSKVFDKLGTYSVNSRVDKVSLQDCMYGHTIIRMVHFILALRQKYPTKRILQSKIDYKSAYRRAHLNWATAIQSMTQTGEFLHIPLLATFGGAPNPPE